MSMMFFVERCIFIDFSKLKAFDICTMIIMELFLTVHKQSHLSVTAHSYTTVYFILHRQCVQTVILISFHSLTTSIFIARQHMPMHAEHAIVMANLSVRLSVRLLHCGIVSKRMHITSNSFHLLLGARLVF